MRGYFRVGVRAELADMPDSEVNSFGNGDLSN